MVATTFTPNNASARGESRSASRILLGSPVKAASAQRNGVTGDRHVATTPAGVVAHTGEPGLPELVVEISGSVLAQMEPRRHVVEEPRDVVRAGAAIGRYAHVCPARPQRLADVGQLLDRVVRVQVFHELVREGDVHRPRPDRNLGAVAQHQLEVLARRFGVGDDR